MTAEINKQDVDRRIDRLREQWGEFHVEREEQTVPPESFEELTAAAHDGWTGSGYVWTVRDPGQAAPLSPSTPDVEEHPRVLLVVGRGGHLWAPPGGGREADETYEEAAVREVREETAIECSITGVGGAGRFTMVCTDGREERIHTLYVSFEGEYESGHIQIQPGELNGAAWWRELPANLHPVAEPFTEEWAGGRVTDPDDDEEPSV